MRTSISPPTRTGTPTKPDAFRSSSARYWFQSTKYGPTSAAVSARMNAMASPSRVVCTVVLRRGFYSESSRNVSRGGRLPLSVAPNTLTPQYTCERHNQAVDGDCMSLRPASARACPALNLGSGSGGRKVPRSGRDDLAWIHQSVRIERQLERAHHRERRLAVLGGEVFHLPLANPVLAGTGSFHGQRAIDQAVQQAVGTRDLVTVVHIDQQRQVEVAIADMTEDRRDQVGLGDVALGRGDAFGEPRDRHAYVAGDRLRAR